MNSLLNIIKKILINTPNSSSSVNQPTSIINIAVINKSNKITDTDGSLMCKAVEQQINLHVGPVWNIRNLNIKYYKSDQSIPNKYWVVELKDCDDPQTYGYHTEYDNQIYAVICIDTILQNGGKILYDYLNPTNVTVSSVLSHEVCEMVIDSLATFWAEGTQIPEGNLYALEICDPVQGDSYAISINNNKISLSNFIYPSWFNNLDSDKKEDKYDYLNKLSLPFTMTDGGYYIVKSSDDKYYSVFARSKNNEQKPSVLNAFHRRKKKLQI